MLRHEALQNLVSLNKKGIGLGNRLKNIKCTVINAVHYMSEIVNRHILLYIYICIYMNIYQYKKIYFLCQQTLTEDTEKYNHVFTIGKSTSLFPLGGGGSFLGLEKIEICVLFYNTILNNFPNDLLL